MIETYEVEWRGEATGEGIWGVVETDTNRGRIYILLNGQIIDEVANGRRINSLDKGGTFRASDSSVFMQNSCELVRRQVEKYLRTQNDQRPVFGM